MSINPFYLHGEELSPVRKLLFMKALAGGAPLSEYDATGNPLTFETNVAKPLKSLVASFLPVQSGTGDPSPTNVRSISGWSGVNVWHTGKNLFDGEMELGGIDASTGQNTETSDRIRSKNYIPIPTAYKLFLYCGHETSYLRVFYYREDKTFISTSAWGSGNREFVTNGASYIRIVEAYSTQYNNDIAINYPSTETAYTPYTGSSFPVVFPALTNNLFDKNATDTDNGYKYGYFLKVDGTLSSNEAWSISEYIPTLENETYSVNNPSAGVYPSCSFYDENKTYISSYQYDASRTVTFTTPTGTKYIRISYRNTNIDEIQLVKGSSIGQYEPYNSTIYGGSVDLVTGVLTAEWASIDMGKLTYTERFSYADHIFSAPVTGKKSGNANILSSEYAVQDAAIGNLSDNHIRGYASNENIWLRNDDYSTAASLKTGMDGVQLVYELATPQTWQLTPQQITALIGDNTIWADANGNCEVTYLKKG